MTGRSSTSDSTTNVSFSDIVTIDRSLPLPNVCILTGEETSKKIRCLFHWKTTPFHAGVGPLETIFEGFRFYLQDVPKADLCVPVSKSIYRRRMLAILLIGMSVVATIATCLALLLGQQWIDSMPKGPLQKQLNDFLIPGIAILGVAVILPGALVANKLMPGITTTLNVEQITATHIRLRGVSQEFRKALEMTQHDH